MKCFVLDLGEENAKVSSTTLSNSTLVVFLLQFIQNFAFFRTLLLHALSQK